MIMRFSTRRALLWLALLSCISFPLASCGTGEPDCGSNGSQELVVEIVKEHAPAELLDAAAPITRVRSEVARDEALAPYDAKIRALQAQQTRAMNYGQDYSELSRQVTQLEQEEVNRETGFLNAIHREKEEQRRSIESGKASAAYSLDVIRITAKNSDTGAVECAAKLKATVPGFGEAEEDIVYTIQKTTEGKLYAEVQSLR